MKKFLSKVDSKFFFFSILLAYCLFYVFINYGADLGWLSSDVWAYQFLETQERFGYWQNIPPSYNQAEFYIGFPLFYFLSPALDHGMLGYHIGALVVIAAAYLFTGAAAKKIFGSWGAAALTGLLILIPRFVFPTRTGIIDVAAFRGNILVLPFYILLGHYWIMRGIKDPKQNAALAVCAGISVYLYPPMGIITVGSYLAVALLIHRREALKKILIFALIYAFVAAPFFLNHLKNPDTRMLDESSALSAEESALQSEIIQYKFRGSGFLRTVEFEETKRAVWDETPLIIIFIISLFFLWKREKYKGEEYFYYITKITAWFLLTTVVFIALVEVANAISIGSGGLPVFVDHLRSMRAVGIALLFQAAAFIYFIFRRGSSKSKIIACIIALILIFLPIRFAAPMIRTAVRAIVPESLRLKYNLAPIVPQEKILSYENLEASALWARENIEDGSRIFVFDDMQNEFRFKVLSRHDTNLTNKEGNLWVTSGFENSRHWYEERAEYKKAVEAALSFKSISDFALSIGSTHILIPRGKFLEMYEAEQPKIGEVIYQNPDYIIVRF